MWLAVGGSQVNFPCVSGVWSWLPGLVDVQTRSKSTGICFVCSSEHALKCLVPVPKGTGNVSLIVAVLSYVFDIAFVHLTTLKQLLPMPVPRGAPA